MECKDGAGGLMIIGPHFPTRLGGAERQLTWPQTGLWQVSHGSKRVASAGWILAKVASENWIPWIPQKNTAGRGRDSTSL
jgi:hypothetical protein